MSVVRAVNHIGICVSDLERSVAFYRDALGFEPAGDLRVEGEPSDTLLRLRNVRLHAVYMERDGWRIELLHYESPASPSRPPARAMNDLHFTHMSLSVADLDESVERIVAAGGSVDADTRVEIGGEPVAIFVRDPDGLPLELLRRG